MRLGLGYSSISPIPKVPTSRFGLSTQSMQPLWGASLIKVPKYPSLCELVGFDRGEMSPEDRKVFGALYDIAGADDHLMREILSGAWTVVEDHGAFYRRVHLSGASGFSDLKPYERGSSHKSNDQQYGIVLGRNLRTILLGTTQDGHSWFQLESAPWGEQASFCDTVEHAYDFIKYKLSGRNQGPFGTSEHTDKLPLKIGR